MSKGTWPKTTGFVRSGEWDMRMDRQLDEMDDNQLRYLYSAVAVTLDERGWATERPWQTWTRGDKSSPAPLDVVRNCWDAYSGTHGWDAQPPTVDFMTAMRRALLGLVNEACDADLDRSIAVLTDWADANAIKVIEMARQEAGRGDSYRQRLQRHRRLDQEREF